MPRRKKPPALPVIHNKSQRIRDACADAVEKALPQISALVDGTDDKATVAQKLAAFDKLGKYGVGTRVTVEIVGEELAGIFARVLSDTCDLAPESLDLFMDRLKEELLKLEQGEIEEPPENEAYD